MDSGIKKTKRKSVFRIWLPIICLGFAAFIFNTTEFIPIGLLSSIAHDFHMTESATGIMITIYAWAVAILSLPLMLLFSRVEGKKLLGWILGVFVLSNAMSYFSNSFYLLMASRIGVACAHAIFWSITPPMAVRIAPPGKRSMALSILTVGSSLAMILGLPIGRTIGLYLGWRITFLSIAVTAFIVMILLMSDLPIMPSKNKNSVKSLPLLLQNKPLVYVFLLTMLTVTGHFCGYSYVEPYLIEIGHLAPNTATLALLAFGITGIIGSIIFTKYSKQWSIFFSFFSIAGIILAMLLLKIFAFNAFGIFGIIMIWGISVSIFNLSYQYRVIQLAPNNTDIAMSIYSGIYNVGIGGGAFVGGMVSNTIGLSDIGYAGAAIALLSLILGWTRLRPLLLSQQSNVK